MFFLLYRSPKKFFTILVVDVVLIHQSNHVHECGLIHRGDDLRETHESLQYENVLHDVYVPMNDVVYDELKL